MERLKEASTALATLEELFLDECPTTVVRDASIHSAF